jgi:hypothetical protein
MTYLSELFLFLGVSVFVLVVGLLEVVVSFAVEDGLIDRVVDHKFLFALGV